MTHTQEKALRSAQHMGKPALSLRCPEAVRDAEASVRSTDPARAAVVLAAATSSVRSAMEPIAARCNLHDEGELAKSTTSNEVGSYADTERSYSFGRSCTVSAGVNYPF